MFTFYMENHEPFGPLTKNCPKLDKNKSSVSRFSVSVVYKSAVYGGPQLSQQIKIHRGKFKFTAANSNSPRQIQIPATANLKFTVANSNSPWQIQIHHGKFKFTTANSNSPRQIQIHHSKLKFTTANLKYTAANSNLPRQIQRVCLLLVLLQELGLSLGALGWFW